MSRQCDQTTSTRRHIDDGGLGALPRRAGSREAPARTKLSRTRLRTAPERSRVHPFAFARLRMAVSERLCWRRIQARAISDRLRGVGHAFLAHAKRRRRAAHRPGGRLHQGQVGARNKPADLLAGAGKVVNP